MLVRVRALALGRRTEHRSLVLRQKEILSLVENNTWEITSINKLDPSIKPLKAR